MAFGWRFFSQCSFRPASLQVGCDIDGKRLGALGIILKQERLSFKLDVLMKLGALGIKLG